MEITSTTDTIGKSCSRILPTDRPRQNHITYILRFKLGNSVFYWTYLDLLGLNKHFPEPFNTISFFYDLNPFNRNKAILLRGKRFQKSQTRSFGLI